MPANPIPAQSDQYSQPPQPSPHQNKRRPHPTSINGRLSLSHQVQVKSAEFWLMLGESDEAVRELEALPIRAWNHPSAIKVRVAALEVLRERTGAMVQI
jgi:hypothetical protein